MNAHFTRTKTAVAVSALMAALAMPPANAVEIAGNGLGDAALSSFYSVRANQATSISVVNTSDDYVVAFHIRFRQSTDSTDVRDFNVFLSPNDVWNASLSLNTDGTVAIKTVDVSCTAPTLMPKGTVNNAANRQLGWVLNGQTVNGLPVRQMDLSNNPAYNSTARDGYFEIIELGVALPKSETNPDASLLASWAVKQQLTPAPVVQGVPLAQDCAALASVYPPTQRAINVTGSTSNPLNADTVRVACNLDTGLSVGQSAGGVLAFRAEFCEPLNVLKVASNVVRVNTGVIFDAQVTTLANFASPGTEVRLAPIVAQQDYPVTWPPVTDVAPGTEDYNQPNADDLMAWTPDGAGQQPLPGGYGYFPNLLNGRPGGYFVRGGTAVVPPASPGYAQDPVAAVSQQIFNGAPVTAEFLPAGLGAVGESSFLATVYAVDSLISATAVINEWQSVVAPTTPQTGWILGFPTKWYHNWGCSFPGVTYWNREEREVTGLVMPSPQGSAGVCGEVNQLSFRLNKNFFGGINVAGNPNTVYSITGVEPVQQGFTAGWARLSFGDSFLSGNPLLSTNGFSFSGYPVNGFAATTVTNGAASSFNTAHAYDRVIGVPAP